MTRPTRRPLVAGNWKLHCTLAEARSLARGVASRLSAGPREVDVAVAPPFTALSTVGDALAGTTVALAAQDVFWEPKGAYTGEVSAPLLRDVGCRLGIVGHSERRHLFGETDEQVRRKLSALLDEGLTPILCVGERLEEREAGRTLEVVLGQLDAALEGLRGDELVADRLVVAYEPVWAIGTGRTASPADAQQVHQRLRERLAGRFGDTFAGSVRLLYGGSVKPDNAAALLAQPDVDGALVGGASLQADSFVAIVRAAC